MNKVHTSERLKEIMNERNLKQVDILNLAAPICEYYDVRLGRNDISQYLSRKVEPGQKKLFILAKALDVSEAWLMGCDVPKERNPQELSNKLLPPYPIEPEGNSVASDLKMALMMQNIDATLAGTYTIHGSEGKGTVVTPEIPKDKYLLIGEGNISELTKKEYGALKSVLDAMSFSSDEE